MTNEGFSPVVGHLLGGISCLLYLLSSIFRVQTIDNLIQLIFSRILKKQFLEVYMALWFDKILAWVVSGKYHLNSPPSTAPSLIVVHKVIRHIEGLVTALEPLIHVENLMIFDNGIVILWLFVDFLHFSQFSHIKKFSFKPTYTHLFYLNWLLTDSVQTCEAFFVWKNLNCLFLIELIIRKMRIEA